MSDGATTTTAQRAAAGGGEQLQVFSLRLPRDLHAALLTRARQDDRTAAQTARVALRRYLAEQA